MISFIAGLALVLTSLNGVNAATYTMDSGSPTFSGSAYVKQDYSEVSTYGICETEADPGTFQYVEIPFTTHTGFLEVTFGLGTCTFDEVAVSLQDTFNPSDICNNNVFWSPWSSMGFNKTGIPSGKSGVIIVRALKDNAVPIDCTFSLQAEAVWPAAVDIDTSVSHASSGGKYCFGGDDLKVSTAGQIPTHVSSPTEMDKTTCTPFAQAGNHTYQAFDFLIPNGKAKISYQVTGSCTSVPPFQFFVAAPRFNPDDVCDMDHFYNMYMYSSGDADYVDMPVPNGQFVVMQTRGSPDVADPSQSTCCVELLVEDSIERDFIYEEVDEMICFDSNSPTITDEIFDFGGSNVGECATTSTSGNFQYSANPISIMSQFSYELTDSTCAANSVQVAFTDNFDATDLCNNTVFYSPKVYDPPQELEVPFPPKSYAVVVNNQPGSDCCVTLRVKNFFPKSVPYGVFCFTEENTGSLTQPFKRNFVDNSDCSIDTSKPVGAYPYRSWDIRSLDPVTYTYDPFGGLAPNACTNVLVTNFIHPWNPSAPCDNIDYFESTTVVNKHTATVTPPVESTLVVGTHNINGSDFDYGCCVLLGAEGTTNVPTMSTTTKSPTVYSELNVDGTFTIDASSERSNGRFSRNGTEECIPWFIGQDVQFMRFSVRSLLSPLSGSLTLHSGCTGDWQVYIVSAPFNENDICDTDFFWSTNVVGTQTFGPVSMDFAGNSLPPSVEVIVINRDSTVDTCTFDLAVYGSTDSPAPGAGTDAPTSSPEFFEEVYVDGLYTIDANTPTTTDLFLSRAPDSTGPCASFSRAPSTQQYLKIPVSSVGSLNVSMSIASGCSTFKYRPYLVDADWDPSSTCDTDFFYTEYRQSNQEWRMITEDFAGNPIAGRKLALVILSYEADLTDTCTLAIKAVGPTVFEEKYVDGQYQFDSGSLTTTNTIFVHSPASTEGCSFLARSPDTFSYMKVPVSSLSYLNVSMSLQGCGEFKYRPYLVDEDWDPTNMCDTNFFYTEYRQSTQEWQQVTHDFSGRSVARRNLAIAIILYTPNVRDTCTVNLKAVGPTVFSTSEPSKAPTEFIPFDEQYIVGDYTFDGSSPTTSQFPFVYAPNAQTACNPIDNSPATRQYIQLPVRSSGYLDVSITVKSGCGSFKYRPYLVDDNWSPDAACSTGFFYTQYKQSTQSWGQITEDFEGNPIAGRRLSLVIILYSDVTDTCTVSVEAVGPNYDQSPPFSGELYIDQQVQFDASNDKSNQIINSYGVGSTQGCLPIDKSPAEYQYVKLPVASISYLNVSMTVPSGCALKYRPYLVDRDWDPSSICSTDFFYTLYRQYTQDWGQVTEDFEGNAVAMRNLALVILLYTPDTIDTCTLTVRAVGPTTGAMTGMPTVSPNGGGVNTNAPSKSPASATPTESPSKNPASATPTQSPSKNPASATPTESPSKSPASATPTESPSKSPASASPSASPTVKPSTSPASSVPSASPQTSEPTRSPLVCPPTPEVTPEQCNATLSTPVDEAVCNALPPVDEATCAALVIPNSGSRRRLSAEDLLSKCPKGCANCDDRRRCLECSAPFVLKDNKCCPPGCNWCTGSAYCLRCNPEFDRKRGDCCDKSHPHKCGLDSIKVEEA